MAPHDLAFVPIGLFHTSVQGKRLNTTCLSSRVSLRERRSLSARTFSTSFKRSGFCGRSLAVSSSLVSDADALRCAFLPPLFPGTLASINSFITLLADVPIDAQAAVDAAKDAADVAAANPGIFDQFVEVIENALKLLEANLDTSGVPFAYGFAIIFFTIFVKILTLPLTQTQMTSAMAMQTLQPKMKAIQKRYANDPQKMQLETARLYKESGVNPLAGCLPSLATLPVWIGLYRALTALAKEGALTKGFFWIPSLAGPATIDSPGLTWLFPFIDGHPPVGWASAAAYMVLPFLLVSSQMYTMKLNQPATPDPQQAVANSILKVLPFMLGYFSLTMPSGLSLYWFTNNILSTLQQWVVKKTYAAPTPSFTPLTSSTPAPSTPATPPVGFSAKARSSTIASSSSPSTNGTASSKTKSTKSSAESPSGESAAKPLKKKKKVVKKATTS
eukprot:CAMPEP_0184350190 /NCGR_PEP_ID=MMETSP1089-20130417/37535_1 /TAXON_ID=38269 ORGANISM="Gloeochaete wittrockiana, Strain SAG46.84" /NCGR_SAMPLE_ID=MMETSP1089 /ASSEMBLY_ACC=CAM_ASM_000445 /LENGTH=445 /DNA_ID=CAMNT_0026682789 /DNA_START=46 /DNA_END=1383 /DNA_ORIENTATION=+